MRNSEHFYPDRDLRNRPGTLILGILIYCSSGSGSRYGSPAPDLGTIMFLLLFKLTFLGSYYSVLLILKMFGSGNLFLIVLAFV